MNRRVKSVTGTPLSQVIQPGPAHFAMIEKVALHNLDTLMRKDMQAARLVMSLIRLMEPGSGGVVVISRVGIAELLDVSMPTVQRALKTLVEGGWVHRIRIGGAYALAINKEVAWVGPRGQMNQAVFSATVVASRSEQDEFGLNPGALKQIPVANPYEGVLPVGVEPDPPSQPGLDGVPPLVAHPGEISQLEPAVHDQKRLEV
jgi:hypothetical protein